MFNVNVEKIGDVAILHCEGRVVHSDAVFKLRDAVKQQRSAHTVLLDLSEVDSLEGGGVGMLVFLKRWTHDRGMEFKLLDPPDRVRQTIEHTPSAAELEIDVFGDFPHHLSGDSEANRAHHHG
jgi:anti-anti-sigma factor